MPRDGSGPLIVLANGCFDPLHFGHLLHLRAAREMGDRLVVALTSDASVTREKGEDRPLFNESERSESLKELRCVSNVLVFDSVRQALEKVRPDIFVKGCDYLAKGVDVEVREYCADEGIEIRFTTTPKWSATDVAHELRSRQPA